ncbi:energy transducer TonB [Roseomonas sp. USHLN139]|uniref:energy transducer TonB n=1 Tax=Roseomonas sp. USHLN139 TaxID=3081298 RepID=UPI003B021F15
MSTLSLQGPRLAGWGVTAILHGGVLAILIFGLPEHAPPPAIVPLEMIAPPSAPEIAQEEPAPVAERVDAVEPPAPQSSTTPPPPSAAAVPPEPLQTTQPPPEVTAMEPPPPEAAQEPELAPPVEPETLQAVVPEAERSPEPDALPLLEAEVPPPPPAPPPPPPQQARPPAPPPPRPVPRRPTPPPPTAQPSSPPAATAAPSTAAPAAAPPQAAAPAGRGPSGPPVSYQSAISAALNRAKRYPNSARLRRIEGVAHLRFRMQADGTVTGWRIERSSGSAELDEAVGEMIERARLPPFPPEMGTEPLEMVVPVNFFLR